MHVSIVTDSIDESYRDQVCSRFVLFCFLFCFFFLVDCCCHEEIFVNSCFFCVQVFSVEVPTAEKRNGWWRAFYRGAAFPTLARFLLLGKGFYFPFQILSSSKMILCFAAPVFSWDMELPADVASNWLGCFPFSAQKHVYDVFFVRGLVSEVLQILVPFLQLNAVDGLDVNAVLSNSERYGCSHCAMS